MNSQGRKRTVILVILAYLALAAQSLWYYSDHRSNTVKFRNGSSSIDLAAGMVSVLWLLSVVIAIRGLYVGFVRQRIDHTLVPAILAVIVGVQLPEGRILVEANDIDFSTHTVIALKETGIWRCQTSTMHESSYSCGSFEVQGDTLLLHDNLLYLSLHSAADLRAIMRDGRIGYRWATFGETGSWPPFGEFR